MIFIDVKFVEDAVIDLIPVLFENYEDGVGDFAYLGGVQGRAKLESALAQPRQTFGGEYLYETIEDKTAAMIWSITKNHPFVDGNKRAALTSANLFLLMNGYALLATQNEALKLCLRVAGHGDPITQEEVASELATKTVSYSDPDFAEMTTAFIEEKIENERDDLEAVRKFLEEGLERVMESLILARAPV